MHAPILVTGGTGRLGGHVVSCLQKLGRDVRILSRNPHPAANGVEYVRSDLATGTGIGDAAEGVETIIHCAGSQKGDEEKTRNLLHAVSRAGIPHIVYISVVGADRIPIAGRLDRMMFGYFESKLAAERVVAESGLPWTTLRSTQFQGSMLGVARHMARLPVLAVPSGFRFQPVDEREVAGRLVELALARPAGLVQEIGGPAVYDMAELLRSYLRATHRHRSIVSLPMPGTAAAAFRSGANLAIGGVVGRRTWEEYLAANLAVATERGSAAA